LTFRRAKTYLRGLIAPQPLEETGPVTQAIAAMRQRHPAFPYCPVSEGNLLYRLASWPEIHSALEIGFATGSTALYLLEGMSPKGDKVVSIDFKQSDFDYLGVEAVKASPHARLHTLIEGNTNVVLPRLLGDGACFGLIFLDGWKVFDHLMLDAYYACRLLQPGGFLVFDDAIMPSTRKVISVVRSYYGFTEIDYAEFGETWRLRAQFMTTQGRHAFRRPYRAFRKPRHFDDLPAISQYDFWRRL
jgi:predicted O-methyltransferase YrrM